jgi:hypothetical protein
MYVQYYASYLLARLYTFFSFIEVLFLTYDIVRRVPAHTFQQQHQFRSATIIHWTQVYSSHVGQRVGLLSEYRRYPSSVSARTIRPEL